MARGTPAFYTGTVPSSQGTSIVNDMFVTLDTVIQSYQSNATTAWELYDQISTTPGSRNHVYRSVGDRTLVSGAGDARLYLRMTQTGIDDIRFSMFQDWSDLSSTGSNEAGGAVTTWLNLNRVSGFRYWAVANEYEIFIMAKQDSFYHWVHVGTPIRAHIPTGADGVAFTTAAAAAGSSVTVNLDRDISGSLRDSTAPGGSQMVWIYNNTPTATALRSATIEVAEVETITATTITFANLVNSFESGALVGLDPCSGFVNDDELVAPSGTTDQTVYWTSSLSGGYFSSSSQVGDREYFLAGTGIQSAVPSTGGYLNAARAGVFMDQSLNIGFRGIQELVAFGRMGGGVDGDFFRPNFVTANQYIMFPSLIFGANGPALLIGPGAT